jgi:S1-C subfamily serine protease
VVGVATQIASEGGRNEGIGFAVPSSVVRRTAERIIATGRASLPYLGIMGGDVGDGIALQDVLPGGPAVGLLRPGDGITAVEGDPGTSNAALAAALADRRPGEQVTSGVLRAGDAVEVPVTLAERPPAGP